MPDINPAELSRPAMSLSTPILANKSITVSASLKPAKASQIIPPRIDLEQAYLSLKGAIGSEAWKIYKNATTQFLIGTHCVVSHHTALRRIALRRAALHGLRCRGIANEDMSNVFPCRSP